MKGLLLGCLLLTVIFEFGCGSTCCECVNGDDSFVPEARLVKDTDTSFHFQWNERLKEERIILATLSFITADNLQSKTILIRFSPNQFRSPLVQISDGTIPASLQPTVEILPAMERTAVPTPTHFYDASSLGASDWYNYYTPSNTILAEHPFKPYEIGVPSKLIFEGKN